MDPIQFVLVVLFLNNIEKRMCYASFSFCVSGKISLTDSIRFFSTFKTLMRIPFGKVVSSFVCGKRPSASITKPPTESKSSLSKSKSR